MAGGVPGWVAMGGCVAGRDCVTAGSVICDPGVAVGSEELPVWSATEAFGTGLPVIELAGAQPARTRQNVVINTSSFFMVE